MFKPQPCEADLDFLKEVEDALMEEFPEDFLEGSFCVCYSVFADGSMLLVLYPPTDWDSIAGKVIAEKVGIFLNDFLAGKTSILLMVSS